MKKILTLIPIAITALLSFPSSAEAGKAKFDMFDKVHFDGEVRPRYEYIKDADKESAGSTRIKLGIRSTKTFGFDWLHFYAESNSVGHSAGESDVPVANKDRYLGVMDYSDSRVSQLYPELRFTDDMIMRIGRQKVNMDDERMVGSDDWRQMSRTFDGVSFVATTDRLSLLVSYYMAVNETYSDLPRRKANDVFFELSYKLADPLKFSFFVYEVGSISTTYEVAATGTHHFDGSSLVSYKVKGAYQGTSWLDVSDRVTQENIASAYFDVGVGANFSGFFFGGEIEGLSANTKYNISSNDTNYTSFQTPYASSHKFNGWTDVFIETPNGGLLDAIAKVGYKSSGFGKLELNYHVFRSFKGEPTSSGEKDTDLGKEIDAMYRYKFQGIRGFSLMAAGSWYSGGSASYINKKSTKYWLEADYKIKLLW